MDMEGQLWLPLHPLIMVVTKMLPQGALLTVGRSVNWYRYQ